MTAIQVLLPALLLCLVLCGASAPPPALSYGGVAAAGGDGSGEQSSTEVYELDPLPDLPRPVYQNSLTALGTVLYSCGGFFGTEQSDVCYTLDTSSSNPQWNATVVLPEPMNGHSAVPVGDHIWFFSGWTLYDFDSKAGDFQSYTVPTEYSSTFPCSVSNDTHSYMVALGGDANEIWVNTEAGSPAEWKQIFILPSPKPTCGCMLYEDQIIISGGMAGSNGVEIYDTQTGQLNSDGRLKQGRYAHKMFLLDGLPAVAGGYETRHHQVIDSIETYNPETGHWNYDNRTLETKRAYFGLAQFVN